MLEEKNGFTQLNVIVIPKSSKNEVVGIYNNVLKIKVMAAPEKGKANTAVIEVLVKYFKIKKSQIRLMSGKISRSKVFRLEVSLEEAKRIIYADSRLDV